MSTRSIVRGVVGLLLAAVIGSGLACSPTGGTRSTSPGGASSKPDTGKDTQSKPPRNDPG